MMSSILRFERKALIPNLVSPAALAHDLIFKYNFESLRSPYPVRSVHNIYFDTLDYKFYHQGLEGDFKRKKVRIRWYTQNNHDLKIVGPVYYEEKSRVGDKGYKIVEIFDELEKNVSIYDYLKSSTIKDNQKLKHLTPTLINSYNRHYYNYSLEDRITIDTNLKYWNPQWRGFGVSSVSENILEIKTKNNTDGRLNSLFRVYQPTKISKYLIGVNKVGRV